MGKQCLKSGCNAPAVDHNVKTEGFKRKQYCATHYEAYKAKQRWYREIKAKLRDCDGCGTTLTKSRHDNGARLCFTCEDRRARQEQEQQTLIEYMRREDEKRARLTAATTVEELKSWIKEYVL